MTIGGANHLNYMLHLYRVSWVLTSGVENFARILFEFDFLKA